MKMNTTHVIGLCFSVIIAIKADDVVTDENENDEYAYTPSTTLMEMEDSLPEREWEFVEDYMVKETMCDVFSKSMVTPNAENGWIKLRNEWNEMLGGPEASPVVGTFFRNFHKIVTTNRDGNVINVIASTVHGLLGKIAVERRAAELSEIRKKLSVLLGLKNTPPLIDELGELSIHAAERPNAVLFVRQFFEEVNKFMDVKNINGLLNAYFNNIVSLMSTKTLRGKAQITMEKLPSDPKPSPKKHV